MYIKIKDIPELLRLTPEAMEKIIAAKVADLREYFAESSYHKTAVIGLSGGIDSALSAAFTALALGPENVIAVRLPFKNLNDESLDLALKVAQSIGLPPQNLVTVDITKSVEAGWESIAAQFFMGLPQKKKQLRIGNMAARERMRVLMDICTAYRALLIGTENRTEELLAYFTIGGDNISHIEPIQDLWKTQVFQLAAAIKTPAGRHLPESVLSRAPSAELWEGQTDEGELNFSYLEADTVLVMTEDGKTPREISKEAGISRKTVNAVLRRVSLTKRKRHSPRRIHTLPHTSIHAITL